MRVSDTASVEGRAWSRCLGRLMLVAALAVGPIAPARADAAPPAGAPAQAKLTGFARILVLVLIYVTAAELNHLFGDGELRRLLLTHRPSELQLNRRQRILELVRLSRLADAHSVAEFRDPTSAAHLQLIEIVRRLAP